MKTTQLLSIFFLFFFFASQNLIAQEVYTEFTNPSFEDLPRPQQPPYGWWDCGFNGETPPDTHPMPGKGSFGVTRPAQEGNTYLGMVVRENDTWESVCQRLNQPLESNDCYVVSIFLCTSETYTSALKNRPGEISFTDPVRLRIWGGSGFCNQKELLAETTLIDHHDWREYTLTLAPTKKTTYLTLEAYHDDKFINGNLLLDNLSPIYSVKCDEVETANLKRPNPSPRIKKAEPRPIVELEKSIIGFGETIKFNDDNQLTYKAETSLVEIIEHTKKTKDIRLVIAVKTKNKNQNSEQVKILNDFLKEHELSNKQYTVRKTKRLDKTDIWFSENSFLYIGLQDIE